jgi:hypothetical protein
VVVYAVIDESLSPAFLLGDALEVYVRREDAERFIEEVRGDEPELATSVRIEEPELEAGGRNLVCRSRSWLHVPAAKRLVGQSASGSFCTGLLS